MEDELQGLGAIPGSRKPNPQAVSALTGFDPERIAALERRIADLEQWANSLDAEPFEPRASLVEREQRLAAMRARR